MIWYKCNYRQGCKSNSCKAVFCEPSIVPKIISVVFEEGSACESINDYAFGNCFSLISVVIPDGVSTIKSNVFYHCTSLTILCEAEGPGDNWNTNWNCGCNVVWGYKNIEATYVFVVDDKEETIKSSTFITLPTPQKEGYYFMGWSETSDYSTVTVKGVYYNQNGATLYAKVIEKEKLVQSEGLVIENGYVTGIGTCKDSIIYIDMPIAEHAFLNCGSITTVIFGNGVTEIGYQAFMRCNNLKTAIFINPIQDTSKIDNDCFAYTWNATDFRIYVPTGSLDSYKTIGGYFNTSIINAKKIVEYASLDEVLPDMA